MTKLLSLAVLWGLAALLLTLSFQMSTGRANKVEALTIDTSGNETPEDNALYINGYNIPNLRDIPLADFYSKYARYLQEPISGFDGSSQWFRFGRVTFSRSNPPEFALELGNAGWADMEREGYRPSPGASPHPAVRDLLISEQEVGVDIPRVYGRVISEPVCDRKTHRCIQWTDKQRLEVDESATTAEVVARAPLGLWLTHPKTRTTEVVIGEASNPLTSPLAILASFMFLVGVLLLLRRPSSSSVGAPI